MNRNTIILIVVLTLTFAACSPVIEGNTRATASSSDTARAETTLSETIQTETIAAQTDGSDTGENRSKTADGNRVVRGINGETLSLPPAEDIKSVVIMAPLALPSLLNVMPEHSLITGVNPSAFSTSEHEILNQVFPEWQRVETAFLEKESYSANIEELLKLKPDVIFYDAKWQSDGMDKLDIPLVDINVYQKNNDIERTTLIYERTFKEIFGVTSESVLQSKWDDVNTKLSDVVDRSQDRKTALFIWSNMADKISIYGSDTYVETFCDKLHLKNVADELSGFPEVSMEQVYQWNPDYIFILKGFSGDNNAERILTTADDNDWSKLKAFENKTIYDVPKTLLGWISPSTDSPLMIYWLISKCYPDKLSAEELTAVFHEHYQTVHHVDLDSDVIRLVLEE